MKGDASVEVQNDAPRARALRALRGWLTEGVLRPGDMLPPERDISLRLGVGLGTVQRALKMMEDEGLIIKRAGRTRMIATPADESASVLVDSVLVIADAVDMRPGLRMYGWGGYVGAGAMHAMSDQGLHAVLISPQRLDEASLERLLAGSPRGLIVPEIDIPEANPSRWLELAVKARTATTVFGDEPGTEPFDRVVPDHEAGAYELTKWLLGIGRRSIRQFWTQPQPTRWSLARRAGYERAMREAGLQPLSEVRCVRAEYPGLDEAAEFAATAQSAAGALIPYTLGNQQMDAIMVDTDGNVPTVAAALKMLGKAPNKDIAVVGFDDYWDQNPKIVYENTPPLATVNKNNFECGRQLTLLLQDRLDGKLPPEPQIRLIAPTLSVRDA